MRGWVCAIGMVAGLAGCTSEERVRCDSQAVCEALGALCVDGFCRKTGPDMAAFDAAAMPGCGICGESTAPICDEQLRSCRGCRAGECPAATPMCLSTGACVECVRASDCTAFHETCDVGANRCVPCTADAQCELGYCVDGHCASSDEIVHVDAAASCAVEDGSAATPFCELGQAVASGKPFIIIANRSQGNYQAINLTDTGTGFLRIIGPGIAPPNGARMHTTGVPAVKVSVPIGGRVRLVITGMVLRAGSDDGSPGQPAGIDCAAAAGALADISVQDSEIFSFGNGVVSQGCKLGFIHDEFRSSNPRAISVSGGALEVRRSLLRDNKVGAVKVESFATYVIENNLFVSNGAGTAPEATVYLGPSTTGDFAFNTLWGNNSGSQQTVFCGDGGKLIAASIFLNNTAAAIFSGLCTLNGAITPPGSPEGTSGDPQVDATLMLIPGDPRNKACCIDQRTTGPATDYFGNARPKGTGYDIGAHEAE